MNNTEYNLYSKFDIEQHKKNYVHYLEVVISPEGEVEYAVPSHQEKLIAIACKQKNITRDQLNKLCPPEYYFDFMTWLCMITGYCSVWEYNCIGPGFTLLQIAKLMELKQVGLYLGEIPKI